MEKFNSWKEYYESNQNYYFDKEDLAGADIGACYKDVGVYYYSNIRLAVIKSSDEAIVLTEADPWDTIHTLKKMDKMCYYYLATEFMNAAGLGLTDVVKSSIIESASHYENTEEGFRLFLSEEGWQDWMNDYTDAAEYEECTEAEIAEIEKIQRELFDEAHKFCHVLKRLRREYGYTQLLLSEKFGIPKRTIGDWECDISEPPVWTQNLIINAIKGENNHV